jgi:glycosyltransferase involved in cell wall biosynthesis
VDPVVSIVMPSFQQARFVEAAARSVLTQTVPHELIVLDPGSTDGSREILQRLAAEAPDRVRLKFEPDDGQSDAINRGMALARGEILAWLNSDDLLRPGALAHVVERLAGRRGPAWLYGRAGMIDGDDRPTARFVVAYKNWRSRRFSYHKLLTENFIPQMGVFWNRAMWEAAGPLDRDLHLDMDYDLWFRFAKLADPIVSRAELAVFRVHDAAKGSVRTAAQLADAYATARRHAGHGIRARFALCQHRLYGFRTALAYRFLKP